MTRRNESPVPMRQHDPAPLSSGGLTVGVLVMESLAGLLLWWWMTTL